MEILLVIFKVAGVLMSGVLGVLSSVLKIKNSSGELTKKGKFFIAGSVGGLCIALISQILETYIQRQAQSASQAEAMESAKKLQQIVSDLNRSLQPLGKFSVFIHDANVSLDSPVFDSYRKRLDEAIAGYSKKSQRERMMEHDITGSFGVGADGQYHSESIEIKPSGKYYPSSEDGRGVSPMVFPICYRFVFFKNPINASEYHPMHRYGIDLGDLRADIFMPKPFPLKKDLKTGSFSIAGRVEMDRWEDVSGKIVSMPDFVGSQLLISVCGKATKSWAWEGEKKVYYAPVDTQFSLGSLTLQFDRRKASISKEDLQQFERNGERYWEFRFPTTSDGLERLFSGHR